MIDTADDFSADVKLIEQIKAAGGEIGVAISRVKLDKKAIDELARLDMECKQIG